jgi:hypothetical protein
MDWNELAQDMEQWNFLVSTVMKVGIPLNAGKILSSYITGSLSRKN